jgi:8-oxo-dGTP pyrophosphatase MutT (NUDIX family)
MSFMEFLRGKYDLGHDEYIHRLIENMTQDEQRKLVETPFLTLWTHLWGNGRDTQSPEFYDAKDKFEALDRAKMVREHPSQWKEAEWGFPKGRRMRGETDMDCAVREFMEETNIRRGAYTLCKNLCFTETFLGTNNVQYKHVYFLAFLNSEADVDLAQAFTPAQRREVSKVEWMTLEKCKSTIRPHYTRRREILMEIETALRTFETLAKNQ